MFRIFPALRRDSARRNSKARPRRFTRDQRPICESLEGRTLLTYDFAFSLGIGGQTLAARAVQTDAAGDTFAAGGFSGPVNFGSAAAPHNITSHGTTDI